MIPQQAIQIFQTGLKYLFDVDPTLTEHLCRNLYHHGTIISYEAVAEIRDLSDKFADQLSPVVHELRSLRLTGPELWH